MWGGRLRVAVAPPPTFLCSFGSGTVVLHSSAACGVAVCVRVGVRSTYTGHRTTRVILYTYLLYVIHVISIHIISISHLRC